MEGHHSPPGLLGPLSPEVTEGQTASVPRQEELPGGSSSISVLGEKDWESEEAPETGLSFASG